MIFIISTHTCLSGTHTVKLRCQGRNVCPAPRKRHRATLLLAVLLGEDIDLDRGRAGFSKICRPRSCPCIAGYSDHLRYASAIFQKTSKNFPSTTGFISCAVSYPISKLFPLVSLFFAACSRFAAAALLFFGAREAEDRVITLRKTAYRSCLGPPRGHVRSTRWTNPDLFRCFRAGRRTSKTRHARKKQLIESKHNGGVLYQKVTSL